MEVLQAKLKEILLEVFPPVGLPRDILIPGETLDSYPELSANLNTHTWENLDLHEVYSGFLFELNAEGFKSLLPALILNAATESNHEIRESLPRLILNIYLLPGVKYSGRDAYKEYREGLTVAQWSAVRDSMARLGGACLFLEEVESHAEYALVHPIIRRYWNLHNGTTYL